MGLIISNILNRLINGQQNIRILMIGLDGAGKTTILYKLKLGEIITTIPTIGFNVETVHYKQCTFTVWDIGGQHKIRRLWHHYYQNTKGLIFVIDSNDPERIGDAQIELQNLLEEPTLKNIILLIYANKQDLPNALPLTELITKMHLNRICSKHTWYIQSLCAIHGYGLYEGLDWLSNELTK